MRDSRIGELNGVRGIEWGQSSNLDRAEPSAECGNLPIGTSLAVFAAGKVVIERSDTTDRVAGRARPVAFIVIRRGLVIGRIDDRSPIADIIECVTASGCFAMPLSPFLYVIHV